MLLYMDTFKQVDISKKEVVYREATATGRILLRKQTIERIRRGMVEKGNPLSIATLASVIGAKLTPQLVILCHPLRIERVEPKVSIEDNSLVVNVQVSAHEKTGVEMEALTAVTAALLNIWDVVKQYEKDEKGQYTETKITDIRVVKKVKEDVPS
jgi:cyclic pyranopterin phosphate synthase